MVYMNLCYSLNPALAWTARRLVFLDVVTSYLSLKTRRPIMTTLSSSYRVNRTRFTDTYNQEGQAFVLCIPLDEHVLKRWNLPLDLSILNQLGKRISAMIDKNMDSPFVSSLQMQSDTKLPLVSESRENTIPRQISVPNTRFSVNKFNMQKKTYYKFNVNTFCPTNIYSDNTLLTKVKSIQSDTLVSHGVWTLVHAGTGRINRCKTVALVHHSGKTSELVRYKSSTKKSADSLDEEEFAEDHLELDSDDYDAPLNFKKLKVHVKSLRADSLVSSALDISRNQVDEIFYSSRLRVNGEKLLKKSKQLEEGDYADVIVEKSTNTEDELRVKRVKVVEILSERTSKDKIPVIVKVWKGSFLIKDTSKGNWN